MADAPARPQGPVLRLTLTALRACVRWLRTDSESVSRPEQFVRQAVMVAPFSLIVAILRIRAWMFGSVEFSIVASTGDRFRCRPPDLIQMYLWIFEVWEPDLTTFISRRLKSGDQFVDVGANIGYFSSHAARRVGPAGHVVAIEASPHVFDALRETLERNGHLRNVRTINKAAAAEPGTLTVYTGPAHNIGLTTTVQTRGFDEQGIVDALPLDDLLTEAERRAARLVKIDVEGGEDAVLAGMNAFLEQAPNDVEILIELSPLWWSDTNKRPIDVLQPLFDAGFHAYEMDNNYWPWRYLWPRCVRRPWRCGRDLTKRVKRLDLVMSRQDADAL
jgi:FkbM family methyltransferase